MKSAIFFMIYFIYMQHIEFPLQEKYCNAAFESAITQKNIAELRFSTETSEVLLNGKLQKLMYKEQHTETNCTG